MKEIEAKVKEILKKNNFYTFKIFPGNETQMVLERSELERLIVETKAHGRWFIKNFDEKAQILNLPCTFE